MSEELKKIYPVITCGNCEALKKLVDRYRIALEDISESETDGHTRPIEPTEDALTARAALSGTA